MSDFKVTKSVQGKGIHVELKAGPLGEAILAANSRAKFDVTT